MSEQALTERKYRTPEERPQFVAQGTGKTFKDDDNYHWTEVTRPILEAFLHARYFLEMACKYATKLKEPPNTMPSGWAAFLYLFNIR